MAGFRRCAVKEWSLRLAATSWRHKPSAGRPRATRNSNCRQLRSGEVGKRGEDGVAGRQSEEEKRAPQQTGRHSKSPTIRLWHDGAEYSLFEHLQGCRMTIFSHHGKPPLPVDSLGVQSCRDNKHGSSFQIIAGPVAARRQRRLFRLAPPCRAQEKGRPEGRPFMFAKLASAAIRPPRRRGRRAPSAGRAPLSAVRPPRACALPPG